MYESRTGDIIGESICELHTKGLAIYHVTLWITAKKAKWNARSVGLARGKSRKHVLHSGEKKNWKAAGWKTKTEIWESMKV
jgi:hypothetical protein